MIMLNEKSSMMENDIYSNCSNENIKVTYD